MDLTFISQMMHGKEEIDVLVDYSIEYLYFLTMFAQCIAPQKRKSIFGFHGHFRANVYDDSSPSIHGIGQVYCYICTANIHLFLLPHVGRTNIYNL